MAKRKRWSDSEVQYLLDEVKKDPRNLSVTFMAVAKRLKRTKGAVAYKYYTITQEATKNNTCFTLTSRKYVSCNRKQFSPITTKEAPRNLFTRILNAIFK